jgi:2-polyprenyl-6-methoxyphenol hydroxylase-like FAD-dependent oxidoreductase
MKQHRAIVIGGSLGGLFAANLLLRAGWDVHVYERASQEMEGRGAGIVTHPDLMEALAEAGVTVDASIGVTVEGRVTLGRDGDVVASRSFPQTLTAWGRMFGALRSAFPDDRYHNGRTLSTFSQDAASVSVTFSDGTTAQGDVLVAADGLRSVVRNILAPDVRPVYAGYVAWRGLVEESALSQRSLREMFPFFAFGLPPGEQMIAYPVAGKNNAVMKGQRRYNFVWYRPADDSTTLRDMVTDATGKVWPEGIPPPLIREEILIRARSAAAEVLAPQFAELVSKTENLFFQPIFDLKSEHLAFGRIAILGDAAFVARPHCGMGVTKAAGDAVELVKALKADQDVCVALTAYESSRIFVGCSIVDHARALGAYMQAQIRTVQESAMAELFRTPEAVMRETAVPFIVR